MSFHPTATAHGSTATLSPDSRLTARDLPVGVAGPIRESMPTSNPLVATHVEYLTQAGAVPVPRALVEIAFNRLSAMWPKGTPEQWWDLRDNALAVSGLLSKKMGGAPVMPYQPAGLWEELAGGASQGPYKQSSAENLHRRSIYTYRKRTVPHPTLTTFDAPSFEYCTAHQINCSNRPGITRLRCINSRSVDERQSRDDDSTPIGMIRLECGTLSDSGRGD